MDSRRRPKWENYRRNKNPPFSRAKWQQTVPSWEKQFCKVVGLFDWEALLEIQKFTHLYENVVNWNDSAGEEAFYNAKKRFWADINGLSCDVPLPDPDIYIDEINWDSGTDPELHAHFEFDPVISNREEDHGPVIIFGDSLVSNQGYSTTGWGDDKNNLEQFHANSFSNNHINQWEQNWGDSVNNTSNFGQPDYYYSNNNNAWDFSGNAGYVPWESGWNGDWTQNYANNNFNCELGPYREDKRNDGGWNDGWGEHYGNNNFSYDVGLGSEDKRADGGNEHWNNHDHATRNNHWNNHDNATRNSGHQTSRYKQMPVMGTINR